MSFVAAAGLAISVGGALYSGDQAKQAGKIQGIFADSQARIEEAAAMETAQLIRRAGRKQLGATKAGYVGAGVLLGEGSAQAAEEEVTQGYEHDAYQAILDGRNRASSARNAGANARQAGNDAFTASVISGAGTALSGAGQIGRANGWRTNSSSYTAPTIPKG